MKFAVNQVGKSGRLGSLTGIGKKPGQIYETPVLTLYTRGGNVPHITYEVLQMVSTENFIMHMPLTSIMTAYKSIESFGKDLSEFVGLKEYPSYITPQDPAIETPSGYNLSDKVAIWSKNGKREVDPTKYMKMMESMKPDMYLALCDGDTNSDSSRKRIIKSASRTTSLFKECFKIHHGSEALRNTALLAPLEGGYDIQARRVFTEEIASYDVSGFVLDGLHTNGPEAEKIRYSHIKTVITACVERLPKEKLRVAHGAWNPATILQLVAAGFDMFDTALPYLSTERGAALNFSFDPRVLTSQVESTSAGSQPVPSAYEICLENIIYLEDFNPVLSHCSCLTCKHHTRAYIHHLLKCKELLGRVLLMIHNLHHYLEFFKSIRNAIRDDCLVSPGAFVEGENYQLL